MGLYMIKKISEKDFIKHVENGISVVDFSAKWCGPCKMLEPVVEEMSEYFDGKAEFFKIDVDESPRLANQFEIQSIPALVIMRDGKKEDQRIGLQPKESLKNFIQSYL